MIFNDVQFDQTQATISEVLQHNEYPKILVLSLGTGTEKYVENPDFDARSAANWTTLNWAFVAVDMLGRASSAITDYYLASLFSGFQPPHSTYLRIDVYIFFSFFDFIKKEKKSKFDTK